MRTLLRASCFAAVLWACGLSAGAGEALAQMTVIPPPANAESYDPQRFLIGTWRNISPLPGTEGGAMEMRMTITFRADGTMSGRGTMRIPPEPGYEHVQRDTYQLELNGRIAIQPMRSWEMKLSGQGTTVTSNPGTDFSMAEEWRVDQVAWIVDANTYVDSDSVRWGRVPDATR